ncbi:hypothetical protein [uncultured Psychroserpens sp.]|uniref:hypothetical protein n=1 Tax=uncultured Psychroserpens sp. TaxID=255436 RepID=UPI002604CF85|nr:hypothetical protein [uncultured Psychroserpens sp.]
MSKIFQTLLDLRQETITIIIASTLAVTQLIRVVWKVVKERLVLNKINNNDIDELTIGKAGSIFIKKHSQKVKEKSKSSNSKNKSEKTQKKKAR